MRVLVLLGVILSGNAVGMEDPAAAKWLVPVAGNAYRVSPQPGNQGFGRDGTLAWGEADAVYAVFFRVDRPARLKLSLVAEVPGEGSTLNIRSAGETIKTRLAGGGFSRHELGEVEIAEAGYVRVELSGVERDGPHFARIRELGVDSETAGLTLDFVKTNEGNMFYWGRRGPSVHLTYDLPSGRDLRHGYSEITVPKGQDPIGSYFMANGFSGGYFGIQVKSPTERWVLFSIWSPYQTDNPRDIPEDQRVAALARGPEVRIGEFGNEGSGGQSFLVYPWQAGRTYRFLTEVVPDGKGSTVFTSWFGDKQADEWRLIASFRRPKTDTHLRGFHSFLENFQPTYGHIGRLAEHGNVWVRDTDGHWHECLRARFSVDPTGGGRHRLDFAGGARGDRFYMRNGGFFDDKVPAGQHFTRESSAGQQPPIDPDKLPRESAGTGE